MNTDSTTLSTTSTFAPRNTSKNSKEEPEEAQDQPTTFTSFSHTRKSTTLVTVFEKQRTATKSQYANKQKQRNDRISSPTQITQALFKLAAQMQMSNAVSQQFLDHFISYFARNAPASVVYNSWMGALPNWMASQSSAAVGKAILATSMIYGARQSSNQSMMMEAFKWYGSGLAGQRKAIERMFKAKREPSLEELCTPILLAFFESVHCTSQTAYFQHVMGAAHMLASFGPKRCSEGVLFELFSTMKLQLVSHHASSFA
jgi:hypothetical protein